MSANMGTADRAIRSFLVAPALIALGLFAFSPSSVPAIVLFALAGIMLATSALGFCPLYVLPGISTCPLRPAASGKGGAAAK